MSETPETDAAIAASDGQWSFVLRDKCQDLERRLNAAIRERDNAESDRKQADADTIRAYPARDQAMTRAEEFQMLQELVNTAGSLNHGNNIVANIKRLEEISNLLDQ